MAEPMRVSVIIPTFNRLWALPRSVRQFYGQRLVLEVIVVDDGSTDGTREWLDREAEQVTMLRPIHQPRNKGLCAARNLGVRNAWGEFVMFWDDDMLIEPRDGVRLLVEELERNDGDIISPAFVVDEGREGSLQYNLQMKPARDTLLNKWLLMRRGLKSFPEGVPKGTWESSIVMSPGLQHRRSFLRLSYDEGWGTTAFREETDYQLHLLNSGGKLLACSEVRAVDMRGPRVDNGGCHSRGDFIQYELEVLRNNWRLLRRHRPVIRKALGIRIPILVMQLLFMAQRVFWVLMKTVGYRVVTSMRLYLQGAQS